ncbi:hypothetical protein HUW62_30835 [Myxococcus sp. AM011]|uniref:hypothetical protein n=1 Tax=Myxococcus sp. AM011 TaxID=2745200 RepID=UPI00159527B2|nr:hypothetical protein [Myxococcus sp. AM011]NVJ25627.1 hypothetical protein [Myxococcus sp. AM011]
MRLSRIVFLSVVLWATGCAHSWVPSLPASHGQLSLAMAYNVDPEGNPREASEPPPASLFNPGAQGGVTPEMARDAFDEAVALLKGAPTEGQVRQASATLSAACAVDLFDACEFLLANFQPVKPAGGAVAAGRPEGGVPSPEEAGVHPPGASGHGRARAGAPGRGVALPEVRGGADEGRRRHPV